MKPEETDEVPTSLRQWFVAHALVDLVIALPLLVAPRAVLARLHWSPIDPISARLVAAALLAIGVQSWRSRGEGIAAFRALLNFKLIWSAAAIAGLLIGIGDGAPDAAWAFLSIFIAFFGVWTHYRIRMKQLAAAAAMDAARVDDDEPLGEPDDDGASADKLS